MNTQIVLLLSFHECMHAHMVDVQVTVYTGALAEAIERADLLRCKLDEQDAAACKALEESHQRCDQLQQELDKAVGALAEAKAKASTEAELREIFHLAEHDRSGLINADELLALGQAANPSFTAQKCHDLIGRMDPNHTGRLLPDKFVEVMQKAMEGLSEPARQKGMKAMQAAAEGVARRAEAEAARKEAEAKAKDEAEVQAKCEAEARAELKSVACAKERAEALAEAIERADLLQCKLDEQDAAACKALEESHQRCDQLQQELDKAVGALAEAEAKASTEAELREIFHLADHDRSGLINADALLALGQAANPSFTAQKCHDLIDRMDSNHTGRLLPDKFVEVMQKAMEGLSEPARQKGMKAMQAAAEGVARRAEAEAARKEAEARAKAEAEAKARAQDHALMQQRHQNELKTQHKAFRDAEERARLLQRMLDEESDEALQQVERLKCKLDEQDARARKTLEEAYQHCDQLQQELDQAVTAIAEATIKASTEAELRKEAETRTEAEAEAKTQAEDCVPLLEKHDDQMQAMRKALKGEKERADLLQCVLDEQDEEADRQAQAQQNLDARTEEGLRSLLGGVEGLWLVYMQMHACTTTKGRLGRKTERQIDGRTNEQTGGQKNGRTDGRTDRQMDGQTDRLADNWTNGWMKRQMDGQTDGRTRKRTEDMETDGNMDRWTDGRTEDGRWRDARMHEQIVGRTDGQADGRMDGRTDGQKRGQAGRRAGGRWTHRQTDRQTD